MRRRIVALDRKLGRLWNRACGVVFLMIGLAAGMSLVESDGFSPATHWPGLLFVAAFFLCAGFCFRARRGLIDTLSDSHPEKER